ncbi:MAG TPA: NADH-quinone oxidoreductase subunit M [Terrimicrobiaceae bacterium]|nr:NADH-quinone oxidoreductase subunit M [Terrimicrobiaceae bacterium]
MSPLLVLILLPIAAAALILSGFPARKTAVLGAALNVLVALWVFLCLDPAKEGFQFLFSVPVIPALKIHLSLGADGLSAIMLLLSAVVTLAAVCVARTPDKGPSWFYASLLFISAGAIGAFASIDVFFFYMFHELALIPTFLLIGIWGSGDRQTAAWKITIYLAFGSFVLLIGLIGLFLSMPEATRTFDMRGIVEQAANGTLAPHWSVYLLLVFGFGILVSLFPFHTWAPQAYASAPAPAAMLHAGVLKKFGLYGLLRVVTPIFPPAVSEPFNNLLLVLFIGNILYVGLVTISQRKLDLMLGYSSVMHMGYIFLGILSWETLGLTGAALMLVAHGLSVSALFALNGELRERTGVLEFSELGGLAKAMPSFGLLFGFATMAAIGLPGFANFAGELMIFFGAFSAGTPIRNCFNNFQIATVIAVWGVVISAVYMLRAYRRIFMGPIADKWKGLPDIAPLPRLCIAGLLALLLVAGFVPQLLVSYIVPALNWP